MQGRKADARRRVRSPTVTGECLALLPGQHWAMAGHLMGALLLTLFHTQRLTEALPEHPPPPSKQPATRVWVADSGLALRVLDVASGADVHELRA